jgi:sec-independent protein translocase protein TatC
MSIWESLLLLFVIVLIIGPEQLPEFARSLGQLAQQVMHFLQKAKQAGEHALKVADLKKNIALAKAVDEATIEQSTLSNAADTQDTRVATEDEHSIIDHLIPLRRVLLNIFLAIGLLFLVLLYFAKELFHLLALPLLKVLPSGSQLVATGIVTPVIVPMKFAFLLALILCLPYVLYQAWKFSAPGLYQHEKQWIWGSTLAGVGLFYLGLLFAYFLVCPLLFNFIQKFAPEETLLLPDITHYLNFVMRMGFIFGLAFQVPVIIVILVKTGVSSIASMASKRRYYIVLAFTLGMLLTPPDVISQIMLAIPLWMLFELGLLAARILQPRS